MLGAPRGRKCDRSSGDRPHRRDGASNNHPRLGWVSFQTLGWVNFRALPTTAIEILRSTREDVGHSWISSGKHVSSLPVAVEPVVSVGYAEGDAGKGRIPSACGNRRGEGVGAISKRRWDACGKRGCVGRRASSTGIPWARQARQIPAGRYVKFACVKENMAVEKTNYVSIKTYGGFQCLKIKKTH